MCHYTAQAYSKVQRTIELGCSSMKEPLQGTFKTATSNKWSKLHENISKLVYIYSLILTLNIMASRLYHQYMAQPTPTVNSVSSVTKQHSTVFVKLTSVSLTLSKCPHQPAKASWTSKAVIVPTAHHRDTSPSCLYYRLYRLYFYTTVIEYSFQANSMELATIFHLMAEKSTITSHKPP